MARRTFIDLTRSLDDTLPVYRLGSYADPPFRCTEWCSVTDQGFRVSRVELGTQTGTHIDAPAHFVADGPTLDSMPVQKLVGPYFLIDMPGFCSQEVLEAVTSAFNGEPILFLRTEAGGTSQITQSALDHLIGLSAQVWALGGTVLVEGAPEHEFHRRLGQAGVFLVEDLDVTAVAGVPTRGELFAFPLKLIGTSGAPCRVVVLAATEGT